LGEFPQPVWMKTGFKKSSVFFTSHVRPLSSVLLIGNLGDLLCLSPTILLIEWDNSNKTFIWRHKVRRFVVLQTGVGNIIGLFQLAVQSNQRCSQVLYGPLPNEDSDRIAAFGALLPVSKFRQVDAASRHSSCTVVTC
jgi:hypothetical protein